MIVWLVIGYSVVSDALEVVGVYTDEKEAHKALAQIDKVEWYMEYEVIETTLE